MGEEGGDGGRFDEGAGRNGRGRSGDKGEK